MNEKNLSENASSDYMAQQIADEILSVGLLEDTQLKQEELAEMFGTSRIPIREAFQVLEGQGLIVRLATRKNLCSRIIRKSSSLFMK